MPDQLFWDSRIEGITDVESFFEYAGYAVRDMRRPLNRTKEHIQSLMEQQFATEGEARSGGWERLAEEYERWKMAHTPNTILRLTNEMYGIVTSDEAWTVTPEHAIYLPPSEKAAWHQAGAPDRTTAQGTPNPLPARPILDLDEYDYMAIEDIFYDWLNGLRHVNQARGEPDFKSLPSIFG